MGEMASYYAEGAMFDEEIPLPLPERKDDPKAVWVTKDKRRIPIVKLDDEHLVNIILMLARKAKQFQLALSLDAVACVSLMQGDMARMSVEQEAYAILDDEPFEVLVRHHERFAILLAEARMRRLPTQLRVRVQPVFDALEEHFAKERW